MEMAGEPRLLHARRIAGEHTHGYDSQTTFG